MSEKEEKYLQYLTERFNEKHFIEFVKDLLNLEINDFSIDEISSIQSSFDDYISSYKKIASYEIGIEKIGVFIVKVNDSVSSKRVSSARVMQRNYTATLLDSYGLDAALVAFYSDNESAWRISLVKREAKLTSSGIEQELSQARRYSYLVGEGETVHTAQEFLLKLLNRNDTKFTVSEIEECFDVEKVTDKFFEEYKEKYLQLQEYLEKDKDFKTESKLHEFTSAEFAKKLMGQIVFLYFLQKKGWLGVQLIPNELSTDEFEELLKTYQSDNVSKRLLNQFYALENGRYVYTLKNLKFDVFEINEDIANLTNIFKETKYSMPWGSGDKKFIRNLYEKAVSENKNFFEDYLEPLFYKGLNKDRINSYFALFNCKIPFLNGGTFEELNGYRWSSARFNIPNSLFSNNGDGILDFLDLYNFTIDEDEPLEKEIAVDPEMLGKIFENLLDIKDRRSKGAFYTPREIVYYMCCESLANYLVNKIGIDYNEIIFFIKNGDIISQIDWDLHNNDADNFIIGKTIYNNIIKIDDALINVKVADPAVGSGAFPVGMLTEIVKLRINLQTYMMIQDDLNIISIEDLYSTEHMTHELYELKKQTIENCIYAVDLEPSAVDIAKLRVWLSLIVDYPNDKEPEPLPNLDYKIMQGNSLLDEYKDIKLFDSKRLKDFSKKYNRRIKEKKPRQVNLQISFDKNENIEEQLRQLCLCQVELFKVSDINRKAELKKLVENIQLRIIDSSINDFEKSQVVLSAMHKREKPWFLWQLEFYDVLKNNGGFDIVIGNPPYVDYRRIDKITKKYLNKNSTAAKISKMASLYVYFIEKGLKLLNKKGYLMYINPYQYLSADSGLGIRNYIFNNNISINKIVDVSTIKVFKSADTYTCINSFSLEPGNKILLYKSENLSNLETNMKTINYKDCKEYNNYEIIINNNSIINKLDKIETKLGDYCDMFCGNSDSDIKESIIDSLDYDSSDSKSDYAPCLSTKDFTRYKYDIKKYVKKSFFNKKKRDIFENSENIFVGRMTKEIRALIPSRGVYCAKVNCLTNLKVDKKILWAILNSNLITYYYMIKNESKHMAGGYFGIDIPSIKELPILIPNDKNSNKIIELISENKFADINKIVYELYNISKEEILQIELIINETN